MRITRLLRLSAVGAIAFGAGVVVAPQAEATLQLASVVNGGNLFCAATDPACNTAFPSTTTLNLAAGTVVGGVIINGSSSTTNLTSAILNSASLAVINTNASAVTVTVAVGDTDFVGPKNQFSFSGSGTFQNAVGATVTNEWFDDPANAQPAVTTSGPLTAADTPGNMLGSGNFTATSLLNSYSFNQPITPLAVPDTGPFSMTLFFTFTLPGATAAGCLDGTDLTTCPQLISRGQNIDKFF